jgi:coenzyme PQQ precursor peptide PqqA
LTWEKDCDQNFVISEWMEVGMAWKTPKIVEIAVGAEINCYACAEKK